MSGFSQIKPNQITLQLSTFLEKIKRIYVIVTRIYKHICIKPCSYDILLLLTERRLMKWNFVKYYYDYDLAHFP